jgi:selenocysteine lyase/cysteine desulfurase
MERLDLEQTGGAVRVGLAQYNTVEEVEALMEELNRLK